MSKELEALNGLFDLIHCQESFEKAQKYFDIIEEALHRLESIDNAEPSEALKSLEDIYRNAVFISDYDVFGKQHPTNISPETNKSISVQCDTIKQALLKAQKPKQYLKWEDLEKDRTYKVLLNGIQYELVKRYDDYEYRCDYITLQKKPGVSIFIYEYEKEIFNDLRLERVEEW